MKTIDFLNKTSERLGFKREKFNDANVPTDFDDVVIIPFFSDIKHSYILSSYLLEGFKKKIKNSKYVIICSYPGFSDFFSSSDEFWSLSDFENFKNIFENSNCFSNNSSHYKKIMVGLNENFRNVVSPDNLSSFYRNGFTNVFWEKYTDLELSYPMIQSSSILGKDFLGLLNEKSIYKVFLTPSMFGNSWYGGRLNKVIINKNFYLNLVSYLNSNGIFPVIWNNSFCYNLTNDLNSEDCLFLNTNEIKKVFSCMRFIGCTIDFFGDISKLSLMARSPFILFDERSKFFNTKDDDIYLFGNYGLNVLNKINFSFVSNLNYEKNLKFDIFEILKSSVFDFFNRMDRDSWPTTSEFKTKIPYSNLKKIFKNKKLGTRFVKIKNTL